MPAWTTVVLTLGATLLGGGLALAGTWLTNRHATREREAVAQAQRRERIGRVIGPVRVLLGDIEPTRIAMNVNNTSLSVMADAQRRWQELAAELASFAAGDGSPEVERVAMQLTIAVNNTANRLGVVIAGQQPGAERYGDEREVLEAGKEHWLEAQRLVTELLDLVHGRPPG